MNKKSIVNLLVAGTFVLSSCTNKQIAADPYPAGTTNVSLDRSPSSTMAESPWTTWSEKGKIGGLLELSGMRKDLLKGSLHDPHAHINYQGYGNINCADQNTKVRSADGTCNDLENAYEGAAGVAFGRNVAPQFIDKDAASKINTPSPAVVSKVFFTREDGKVKTVPPDFLNMLAAVWIQFMNHDWLTHGPNKVGNPHQVPGVAGPNGVVDRTQENPHANRVSYKREFGKTTVNDVTHWWDASQIYGSSQAEQDQLRTKSRGKMHLEKVNGRELLPKRNDLNPENNRQNQGYEATGFRDNWWVGLSMLHTLFVKEHNAIADEILKKHANEYNTGTKKFTWRNGKEVLQLDEAELDEKIFGIARLVNSAVLAKIHTIEWTPGILRNDTLKKGMFANWYGLVNPNTIVSDKKGQTKSAFQKYKERYKWLARTDFNPAVRSGFLVGGIVGDKVDKYGVPFSITEEFTSVYRLHSLLPETINLRKMSNKANVQVFPFMETRNDKSYGIMANNDLKDLYYSFGVQLPGQLVLNNFPAFMQNLTIPGHGSMDLGMVDVLRDRERGVPRYNQFRRGIGLKPIQSYKDFFPANKPLDDRQMKVLEKFYNVYGRTADGKDNVEMIDLLVGTLAEEVRPKGFGFGETQFQIFILMASRRLMADRFFTDDYNSKVYTDAGMKWIDDEGSFAQVIVRHMPELEPQVRGLETAFMPWNK